MTKKDFLNFLEQRLMVLNDDERADLLSEYEEHIEMKIASGLSEEEAITGFGDPEELVKELLDAYHLNTNYQSKYSFSARITYYVKSCAHFVSSMFDTLFHYSIRDLFKLFLQACFLLAFLGVILLGGAFFGSILRGTIWQFWIGRVFYDIIALFAWIIYIALAIYLVIFFIKRYILVDYEPLEPPVFFSNYTKEPFRVENFHLDEHFDNAKNYAGSVAEQTGEAFIRMRQKAAENLEIRAAKREGREPVKIPFPEISLSELCMKVVIVCCRFIGFFFLLMAGCAALGLIAATATGLVFLVMGYQLFGPFLIVLGCALLSVVITGFLLQFVFGIGGDKHETV